MQRNYRQWIVWFLTIVSAISFYISSRKEKENKSEKQQLNRLFEEQAKLQEATDAVYGPWNKVNEKLVYNMYYDQSAGAHVDNNVKSAYAACCLGKIKAMFPNGLSNVGDVIKVKDMKVEAECAESINHDFKAWRPEYKRLLKEQFSAFPEVKLLPKQAGLLFVDCLTDKIIAKFPNGTIKGQEKAVKHLVAVARRECVITAMDNYKKPPGKENRKLPGVKDTASVN